MNENYNKSSGLKYFIFIGLPVIFVLGFLGFYYYITNPISILTKTINVAYETLNSTLDKTQINEFNILENPISVKGNLQFKTDMNLNGYEKLQKYNYDLDLGLDYKNETFIFGLGIKENKSDILNVNFYHQNNKQYLESKELYDDLIDITNYTNLKFNEIFNLEDLNYIKLPNKNDLKYIIKSFKEIIASSLNKKYLEREKIDIKINDEQIKTTKITYLLNEENQQRTFTFIKNKILEDQELLNKLAAIFNITEKELKGNISNSKYEYTNDFKFILYTEGFNQNVIKISLEDLKDTITYINYKDEHSLAIENQLIINFKKIEEKEIELDYTLIEENINGTIIFNYQTENQNSEKATIYLSSDSNELKSELNIDLHTTINEELNMPNTTTAKTLDELTPTEITTILEKLETILNENIFLDLFESNIM